MKVEVINIFITAESTFKSMVSKSINKIDSKEMVSSLLENTSVLADFATTLNQADQVIKKEVAMNLLEYILSLYMRTRTFSYVNGKQQLYKMKNDKLKSKSLRTDLKQKTADLDQGH